MKKEEKKRGGRHEGKQELNNMKNKAMTVTVDSVIMIMTMRIKTTQNNINIIN